MMDREMDVSMAATNQEGAERDYEDFLEELEEDKSYRSNVNIFFSELGGRVPCCWFLAPLCLFKCMARASVFTQHTQTKGNIVAILHYIQYCQPHHHPLTLDIEDNLCLAVLQQCL